MRQCHWTFSFQNLREHDGKTQAQAEVTHRGSDGND
jgi:hypothetical protein